MIRVFTRQFDTEAASLQAYAGAVATYIYDSDLDVGFLRGELNGRWTVFWTGLDATDSMVAGGKPTMVSEALAQAIRLRRTLASSGPLTVLHHQPPLSLPL